MHIPFIDKFPVRVLIMKRRGNSEVIDEDKARFIEESETGNRVYELKSNEQKTQPVSYEYIRTTTDGENFLVLYEFERGQYVPVDIKFNDDEFEMEPVEEDVIAWEQYTAAKADEMHKKDIPWYQKYQPYIIMFITFVFLIVMAYMWMNNLSQASQNIVEAFQSGMQQSTSGTPPG